MISGVVLSYSGAILFLQNTHQCVILNKIEWPLGVIQFPEDDFTIAILWKWHPVAGTSL
jgi:hypothetical protein